eukprot:3279055-Rhodomonas_salina.1
MQSKFSNRAPWRAREREMTSPLSRPACRPLQAHSNRAEDSSLPLKIPDTRMQSSPKLAAYMVAPEPTSASAAQSVHLSVRSTPKKISPVKLLLEDNASGESMRHADFGITSGDMSEKQDHNSAAKETAQDRKARLEAWKEEKKKQQKQQKDGLDQLTRPSPARPAVGPSPAKHCIPLRDKLKRD